MAKNKKTGTTISIDVENTTAEKSGANWWKVAFFLLILLGTFFGGSYVGKKSVKNPIENPPIYIPGDTTTIEIPVDKPVYIVKPADTANIIKACVEAGIYAELFPEKVRDSIVFIPTAEDTLEIVRDWATERYYEEKVFDVDTLGTATVRAKTQYNRITEMSAVVVPAVKTVPYLLPPKKFSPFLGAGLTTSSCVMATGGFFIDEKWGGLVQYQRDINRKENIVGASFLYKF